MSGDPRRIPLSRQVRCAQCGDLLDSRDHNTRRAVRGYVRPRKAGGSNMIELPQLLDEYLCRHCVDRRKHGHTWEQLDLFGGQP